MFGKLLKHNLKKFLFIIAVMLVVTTPLVWMQIHYPHQAHSLSLISSQQAHFFTLLRWSLIGLFVRCWPTFIRQRAKKFEWDSDKTNFWLSQRFRLTGWLIVFELLVCENLLLLLIKVF